VGLAKSVLSIFPISSLDFVRSIVIFNAAAYTAVDLAESQPELAMQVNGIIPGILAEEAKKLGSVFVHYSTDYVFNGLSPLPYREEDPTDPLNVYGKTKLVGEQAVQAIGGQYYLFRTSWVYGMRGKNFLLTMLRLAKERPHLRVVNDQIGTPTWSRTVAKATLQILSAKKSTGASIILRAQEKRVGMVLPKASLTLPTAKSPLRQSLLQNTPHQRVDQPTPFLIQPKPKILLI